MQDEYSNYFELFDHREKMKLSQKGTEMFEVSHAV